MRVIALIPLVLALAIRPSSVSGQTLVAVDGDNQAHFAGWLLRAPLKVEVQGASRPTCSSRRVTFASIASGSDYASTVSAEWVNGECIASTRWRLAEEVGEQLVNVSIKGADSAHTQFTVRARRSARVIFGVALIPSWGSDYSTVQVDTISWKTGTAGDATDPQRDTTQVVIQPREVEVGFEAEPMVGVDVPLYAVSNSWTHHVRLSTAVSIDGPADRIFVGFSVIQAFVGLPMEGSAIDLHIGWMTTRRTDKRASQVCLPDGSICRPSIKQTRHRRNDWVALFGTIDASSLLSGVLGMLAG